MLGRKSLVDRIENYLLKPTPDHVSVVGPAHYGKSVLLSYLADAHREDSSHYLTTVYIDLRLTTPKTDSAFMQRFAKEIKNALDSVGSEFSEWLDLEDEKIYELLTLVFDELERKDSRMLIVLDGFDSVLAGTGLTRDLWDNLRELAQKNSLRLVTGSRLPLGELCRTEESRTSEFWGIFNPTPTQVAALDDSDWDSFLKPLRDAGCQLDKSACTEVANWTGGVPLLVCALLRELWESHRGQTLFKNDVDQAAAEVLNQGRQLLADLWHHCDVKLRTDLGALANAGAGAAIPQAGLSKENGQVAVVSRGFGRVSRKGIRGSCLLIQRYAQEQAPAIADLTRLFGTSDGFETHIQSLLELRFKQIAGQNVDKVLHDFVRRAVSETDNPELAINGIRGIVDRALTLIWKAELPSDKMLPCDWTDEWERANVSFPNDQGKLPRNSGAQCHILRLMTGSDRTPRQSKYVKKTTYLLVDHLQSVGDFGQHQEEFPETKISASFAATIVLAAISLVESLMADLEGSVR